MLMNNAGMSMKKYEFFYLFVLVFLFLVFALWLSESLFCELGVHIQKVALMSVYLIPCVLVSS